jgi:phage FluMu gp28-like protein
MSVSDLKNFLLPYQREWIDTPGALAIGEKSRRIGWTYASAVRAVVRRLELGSDLFYSSADLGAAREFIEEVHRFARVAKVVAEDLGTQVIDENEGLTAFVVRFANGAKIVAGSSNPKFFRGKGGDADADEFAFHAQPNELLKAMQATAVVWGHQMRVWSTHNGEGSAFNGLVKEAKAYREHLAKDANWLAREQLGKENRAPMPEDPRPAKWARIKASLQTVTILDAVEQGLVEKIKGLDAPDPIARRDWLEEIRSTVHNEDAWQEEYMCQPSSEQSSLLTYPMITSCEDPKLVLQDVATDPLHVNSPAMAWITEVAAGPRYAGFDVGRKNDRSVLWMIELKGDVYHTRMVREFHQMPYTQQEQFLHLVMNTTGVRRLCIDSTGIGAMLAERMRARWGHRVEEVTFTAASKSEMAMPLVRLFQDRLIRIPADAAIREDLHSVRKTVTAAGNVRLDAERTPDGHGDRFWSLALATHAADTTKVPLISLARKPAGW